MVGVVAGVGLFFEDGKLLCQLKIIGCYIASLVTCVSFSCIDYFFMLTSSRLLICHVLDMTDA